MNTELYPPIEPHATGALALDDLHTMYWECSGNPQGVPVVVVHGGPGAGSTPAHRRFFDPAFYRIVMYDQRGSGRSTPLGECRDNTTRHLIADMETLREHLGIDDWVVFGGSWGSTLALAYAETYAARCRALVLRGIFLCRKMEIDWFLYGMKMFFPEAWRTFAEAIPEAERDDLLAAYHTRLMDPDPAVYRPAARRWGAYEGACSTLLPSPETVDVMASDAVAIGLARIEAHYFKNNIFLPDNALLDRIERVRGVPGFIVQGRYDVVCPLATADELARAWPEADYRIIEDAGHAASEPGIRQALAEAMERLKTA